MELQRYDRALEISKVRPFFWVKRPIWLHEENTTGEPCPCCDSPYGIRTDEIEHLDLLIHRFTGTRRLRHEVVLRGGKRRDRTQSELDQWDELAHGDDVEVIESPFRCYRKQLDAGLDHFHKVVYVSGGQGSGKTNVGGEWAFDSWMLFGGRAVDAGWVSATRDLAYVGVAKLFIGEFTADRYQAPLFDPRLVRSYPQSSDALPRPAYLIDGTRLHFLHAGKKSGGSIKAKPFRWANVDELTEILYPNNWETILGRTGRTKGTVFISSTPRGGHWGKAIYDRGKTSVYFRRNPDQDGPEQYLSETLHALDNIFIDREEVRRTISGRENEPSVRREWGGEWIGDGNLCWRHFLSQPVDEKFNGKTYTVLHTRTGHWFDVENWGLENVTSLAFMGHFKTPRLPLRWVIGQDVNQYPQHSSLIQIACPPGEQADPRKWILFVIDEMVRPGTELEHATFLTQEYPRLAGIDLRKPAMVIDGTATGRSHRYIRKRLPNRATTQASVFRAAGITVVPPIWAKTKDKNQEGYNPHRRDATGMFHLLMQERVMVNGYLWPRLVVSDRCSHFLDAMRTMEANPDGSPRAVSGQFSDEQLGAVQSVWYPAWVVFGREYAGAIRRNVKGSSRGITIRKA